MGVLLLIVRLALAVVFAAAGVGKLLDRGGTREAVRAFGVPGVLVGATTIVLPGLELVIAGLVVVPVTARIGVLGAVGLLVVFSAAIAVNLARGRQPECHCFGQFHSEPIGWPTLARNGVLALAGAVVLALGWNDPGPSPFAWIADLEAGWLVALVTSVTAALALALGGWFAVHLLRQHGRLLVRLERLESALAEFGVDLADEPASRMGGIAPGFVVPAIAGGTTGLQDLLAAGQPTMLVFTDPGCGPCQALMPEIARWQRDHAGEVTIAVLSSGAREAVLEKAGLHGIVRVLLDSGRSVADAYEAFGTPAAVLVAPDATIASPVAQGQVEIERLLDLAFAWQPAAEQGLSPGTAVPSLVLADLAGVTAPLVDRLDPNRQTLLVFWNPNCGFCERMREELRALDDGAAGDATALLVVSTGGVEEVRDEGFSSVLLDPDSSAARAFGASGTPMGVLVSPDGTIESRLAAGAEEVLALADPRLTGRDREPAVTLGE